MVVSPFAGFSHLEYVKIDGLYRNMRIPIYYVIESDATIDPIIPLL